MATLGIVWRLSGLCWDQQSLQLYKYAGEWWRIESQCALYVYQERRKKISLFGHGGDYPGHKPSLMSSLWTLKTCYIISHHFKFKNCGASLKSSNTLLWFGVLPQRSVPPPPMSHVCGGGTTWTCHCSSSLPPPLTECLLGTGPRLGFGIRQADGCGGKRGRRQFKPQSRAGSTFSTWACTEI